MDSSLSPFAIGNFVDVSNAQEGLDPDKRDRARRARAGDQPGNPPGLQVEISTPPPQPRQPRTPEVMAWATGGRASARPRTCSLPPPELAGLSLMHRLMGAPPTIMVAEPVVHSSGSDIGTRPMLDLEPSAPALTSEIPQAPMRRLEAVENTLFNRLNFRATLVEEETQSLKGYLAGMDQRTSVIENNHRDLQRQLGDVYSEIGTQQ